MGKNFSGLTSTEARELLAKNGRNELPETPPPTRLEIFLSQFKSPLVYILLAAGIVTLLLGEIPDTIVIGFAVILNTILGYIQEERASRALQALKSMIHPHANVIRDGKRIQVNIEEVVPGDTVVVNSGDKIPGDGEILDASHFYVSEAVLTGESVAVEKKSKDPVFMGTVVTAGRAYMKVVLTGANTEMGKIALGVQGVSVDTPLRRQLAHFGQQLTYLTRDYW